MDAEDGCHVLGRWKTLARLHVAVGDVTANLGGNLVVKRKGGVAVLLDILHDDRHSITIMWEGATGSTALKERSAVQSPEPPEAVIKEARRRQHHRRLGIAGIVLILAASAVIGVRAVGSGRSGHQARPPKVTVPLHPKPPVQPVQPTLAVGAFGGTWHAQTTSLTIAADGTGMATWPGDPTAGQSQATATPNEAQLRLTSVTGMQATGVIADSTSPAELPDGPVRLQISAQDVIQITPSQPITQYPLRWTALCGPAASALTLARQEAAGINCGA